MTTTTATTTVAATAPAAAAAGRQDFASAKEAPGPRGWPVLGSAGEFQKDPLDLIVRSVREYGDVVKLKLVKTAFVVNHPDGVRHVLHDHHLNYKKNFVYDRLKPVLGNGLLTSSGDCHSRHSTASASPASRR